jgi:hypothetical protein
MEQVQGNGTDSGPSVVWIIVKIAVVILIVFVGIKFFSEKQSKEEEGFVERKTKPTKPRKKKKDEL